VEGREAEWQWEAFEGGWGGGVLGGVCEWGAGAQYREREYWQRDSR
jgi:hypothetical protein